MSSVEEHDQPRINVIREFLDDEEERNPLDPQSIAESATWLLEHNQDHHVLVRALLKQIREHRQQEEAIERGYSHSNRQLREMYDEVVDERNELVHAVRLVKRATRGIRVGRE